MEPLDRPVKYLCDVVHDQSRHPGFLGDEHAWELPERADRVGWPLATFGEPASGCIGCVAGERRRPIPGNPCSRRETGVVDLRKATLLYNRMVM